KGEVHAPYQNLISLINDSGLPVLSVDIPSGLCSDTGMILGNAVKAFVTVTFIARKIGMALAQGPQYCGDIIFDSLDIPEAVVAFNINFQPVSSSKLDLNQYHRQSAAL
ncbi:MAG: NAD(P)H-hydrate epimerase, partial [Pseudohongiellaceae bacterium]